MNRPINRLNKNTSLAAKLFLATTLMAVASVSVAKDENVAYVDSILKWGAWELDIEPAAGGISATTGKTLNARGAKVTLRTNSIAALAPPGQRTPGNDAPINRSPGTTAPQRQPTPIRPIAPPTRTIPTAPPTRPTAPISFAPPGATPSISVTLPSPTRSAPVAPISFAPPGATTSTGVSLPPPPAPTGSAPTGAITATVITLP